MGDNCKKITVYYAEFFAPGALFADNWTERIGSPDPHSVKWPENAYAFQLYRRDDILDGAEAFQGKPRKIGPTYYHPDSKVETLEQVRKNPKATPTLIQNMDGNGWDQIVWSRWGNWPQPYDPKEDAVLTSAKIAEESA